MTDIVTFTVLFTCMSKFESSNDPEGKSHFSPHIYVYSYLMMTRIQDNSVAVILPHIPNSKLKSSCNKNNSVLKYVMQSLQIGP